MTTLGRFDSAKVCRERDWRLGTRLVGDEGRGPTIIEITAVGETEVLAKVVSHDGRPMSDRETLWSLGCRDWQQTR